MQLSDLKSLIADFGFAGVMIGVVAFLATKMIARGFRLSVEVPPKNGPP